MQSDTVSNPKGKIKEKKKIFPRKLALEVFLLHGLYFFWPYLVCAWREELYLFVYMYECAARPRLGVFS